MASLASLPNELLYQIADLAFSSGESHICVPHRDERATCSSRSLNALALACRRFHTLLNPVLYRRNATQCHAVHSCLSWAVMHSRPDTIETAILHGADVNRELSIPGPKTGTALALAVSRKDLVMTEYLLQKDADVERPMTGKYLCVCRERWRSSIEAILPWGYSDHLRVDTLPPLHMALEADSQDSDKYKALVELLVRRGACYSAPGTLAAVSLAERGYHDLVDVMLPRVYEDADVTMALLHLAVREHSIGRVSVMSGLPKASVVRQGPEGDTALHLAVYRLDPAILKLLLQRPEANVNVQNRRGSRLLHLAVKAEGAGSGNSTPGLEEVVGALLEQPDVDVNAVDGSMTTPLFEAAVQGAGRTWQLLLDHPAIAVNRANTEGLSPLHWMARECSRQAMAVAETPSPTRLDMLARLLRDPRVNLRAHTASDGLNVLHMISCVFQDGRMNAIEIAHRLLDGGVPINEPTSRGATALSIAVDASNHDMALALLARGADPLLNTYEEGTRNKILARALRSRWTAAQGLLFDELLLRGVPLDETTDPGMRDKGTWDRHRRWDRDLDLDSSDGDRDGDQGTPLFFAAAYARSPHAVARLLAAGASPNSTVVQYTKRFFNVGLQSCSAVGKYAAVLAAESGGWSLRQPLLYAVVRNLWSHPVTDDDDDNDAGDDRWRIVRMLVDAGAHVGAGGDQDRYSALDLASHDGDAGPDGLLRLLLDAAPAAQVQYDHVRSLTLRYVHAEPSGPQIARALTAFARQRFPGEFQRDALWERIDGLCSVYEAWPMPDTCLEDREWPS